MRIALSEGRLTRWRDLYDELTPRDLAELSAFYAIEPWGDDRADMRTGFQNSILVGALTGAKIEPGTLTRYLSEEDDKIVSPEQAAAMARTRK